MLLCSAIALSFILTVSPVLLGCLAGPTVLQPSAFPVGSQPAQTFHSVSCRDRQGLPLQLEKLEQLQGPHPQGEMTPTTCAPQDLPVFAQYPASCSVLGPARGAQTAGQLTLWSILAPHIASVAKRLQELKDVGKVQLPGAIRLVPPWYLCDLDMT